MDDDLSAECDELLQEFHQTAESGSAPKWEGGMVGKVCLAEGTQLHAKLGDVAFAVTKTSTFEDQAWERVKEPNDNEVSQWTAFGGKPVIRSSFSRDGKGCGLDSTGFLIKCQDSSTTGGSFIAATPFVDVDRASNSVSIAVDENREVFKLGNCSAQMASVDKSCVGFQQVSVG